MNSDEFEKKLQQQPVRFIPGEWRRDILQTATERCARSDPPYLQLKTSLSEWLWPCPQAWAGLVAVWLMILTLNFAMREPENRIAKESNSSPETIASMKEQRRLYLELAELPKETAPSAKPIAPRPRSDRKNEFKLYEL